MKSARGISGSGGLVAWREGLMLCAGALATAALLWAAFGMVRDPVSEGRAALAREAGDVVDGLIAEWRRSASLVGDVAVARLRWKAKDEQALAAAPVRELSSLTGARSETFDALLAEAQRLETQGGGAVEALDLVLRAIDHAPDDGRRIRGRLRAIQIATRVGRADVAGEQQRAVFDEFGPGDALGDTSVRLLAGLAAAPVLDEAQRGSVAHALLADWCDGRLAIPDPVDEWRPDTAWPWTSAPPRRAALLSRLVALAGAAGPDAARLEEDARRRSLAAWSRALGGALPRPEAGGGWAAVALPGDVRLDAPEVAVTGREDAAIGLARRLDDGSVQLVLTTRGRVLRRLSELAHEQDLLPDGFSLDGAGSVDGADGAGSPGTIVRGPVWLLPGAVDLTLRHRDPDAYVSGQTDRARALRAGFVGTGAIVAVAALLSARALRRARLLADMRRAFVASVSHELRTPAASILLMAENLRAGIPSDELGRARYHDLIGREALRLRRLVEDVLDFSRVERGEPVRLQRRDVTLGSFLDDLEREVRLVVDREGGSLLTDRQVAAAAVAALDDEALRRAVLNLVANALRHGGGRVELHARLEGEQLELAVADHGGGIPPRLRGRVFEPFEQLADAGGGRASGAAPGSSPGTGLGLSIVRGIVRAHGGEVEVGDRDEGPGARFTIRLPLAELREASA